MLDFNQIHQGNALELVEHLAPNSIYCLVTSPPYFNLRSYQGEDQHWPEVTYSLLHGLPPITVPAIECQLGREKTIEAYIGHLVAIFRALRPGLREDGVMWVNIGDSYSGSWGNYAPGGIKGEQRPQSETGKRFDRPAYADTTTLPATATLSLERKNLCGIPWRFALAMQADGWILRSDVIWHKTNGLPESVKDRATRSHEYLFLFSKQPRYWFDIEAIKQPLKQSSIDRLNQDIENQTGSTRHIGKTNGPMKAVRFGGEKANGYETRNPRSVWPLPTANFKGSHYAVMPAQMAERCILGGCPRQICSECGMPWVRVFEKTGFKAQRKQAHVPNNEPPQNSSTGWKPALQETKTFEPVCDCGDDTRPGVVLDPFMGSGTVAEMAIKHQRDWMGFDLDPEYVRLTNERINGTQIMMPGVSDDI